MNKKIILLLAILLLSSVESQAGPPYVTDDTETPPRNGWEINIPYTRTSASGIVETEEPLIDINYGLRDNVQLSAESPSAGISGTGTVSASGLGDTVVGSKWRFREETGSTPQLAVFPRVLIPTGNAERRLGAGSPQYVLPLVGQKSWGEWTSFGNIGYVIQTAQDTRNHWYYGIVMTKEITDRFTPGFEIYGNTPTDVGGQSLVGYNIGLQWTLNRYLNLLASAGHSLHGESTSTLYLGLQFVYEPRHNEEETETSRP